MVQARRHLASGRLLERCAHNIATVPLPMLTLAVEMSLQFCMYMTGA